MECDFSWLLINLSSGSIRRVDTDTQITDVRFGANVIRPRLNAMTPEEWKSSDSVLAMLEAMPTRGFCKELISFAASVCQRLKHLLPRESLDALAILEQYVAENSSGAEVLAVRDKASAARKCARISKSFKAVKIHPPERAAMVVEVATTLDGRNAAKVAALACVDLLDDNAADLLRIAVGDPFQDNFD